MAPWRAIAAIAAERAEWNEIDNFFSDVDGDFFCGQLFLLPSSSVFGELNRAAARALRNEVAATGD